MTAIPAPNPVYRWFATHTGIVDVVLTGVLLFFTAVPYAINATFTGGDSSLVVLVVHIGLVLPLVWRRSHPIRATAIVLAICLIQVTFDIEMVLGQVSVLILIAALAAYAPRWASWTGLALGLAGVVLAVLRYMIPGVAVPSRLIVIVVATLAGWSFVGIAWVVGDLTRSRRLEKEALSERADRAERERERDRQLAAAEERAHIARELHDIVAHSLSVVVTQADGARYAAPPSAGPVLPALEAIAETARASLADMRRLLGVLRDGDSAAPIAPAETLADLPRLIETVRSSGLQVRFTAAVREGVPLSAGAQLVLFRVIQESLTNVLKHGGPAATAEVTLTSGDTGLEVRVRDDGLGSRAAVDSEGSGHGLLGMRERVALYHGTVEAGPRDGRGFEVVARLPYDKETHV